MSIKLRFQRNPVIGDKFSSRHGQKGVLSVLWPSVDMPFTESGMVPDILINPHAFPSRMTIGMMVESIAGKAGALHGTYQDATPFQFHEGNSSDERMAIHYFGEQLKAAGYSYYGSEPLYNGYNGIPMMADIFIGVVYYQRLRHMVSDKSQVRSVGAVNPLHRQPIKGRKKGGGVRFGEMERDALLAHGTSYLLHDRLMNSSDAHVGYVCKHCGSMLGPVNVRFEAGSADRHDIVAGGGAKVNKMTCKQCGSDNTVKVLMPYVFRYLANELAGMNIQLTLGLGTS